MFSLNLADSCFGKELHLQMVDIATLRLFRVGCPKITLYDEGAFTTRKLVMIAMDLGDFLANTGRVMAPHWLDYVSRDAL